jgi:hypothetical protein
VPLVGYLKRRKTPAEIRPKNGIFYFKIWRNIEGPLSVKNLEVADFTHLGYNFPF